MIEENNEYVIKSKFITTVKTLREYNNSNGECQTNKQINKQAQTQRNRETIMQKN